MLKPQRCTYRMSQEAELLPPCWLRCKPTRADNDAPFPSGLFRIGPAQTFRRMLMTAIESAQQVVLVASYLFADEDIAQALLRSAKRGVRVYVITASETRLNALPKEDDAFEQRMVDEHKRLLDQLADFVLLRSAEHFHAKFLIVDPRGPRPQGFLSTANFNLALRESVELGVSLSAELIATLAQWFNWVFWNESQHELCGKGRLKGVEQAPGKLPAPKHKGLWVTTRSHTSLRAAVLRIIEESQRELFVSSYGFELDHEVVTRLVEKAKQGRQVTVYTRPRPAVAKAVAALSAAGVRVYAHDKLHAKAVLSEREAIVLTANLESQGLDQGFEVGVQLCSSAMADLRVTFEQWQEQFPWQFSSAAKRGHHLGEFCLPDRGLRDGIREVIEQQLVSLKPVIADDALALDQAARPSFVVPQMERNLPRWLQFEWEVQPPRLPDKAKEVTRTLMTEEKDKNGKLRNVEIQESYVPPVYEHRGKRYVVVREQKQVKQARVLAEEMQATVVIP